MGFGINTAIYDNTAGKYNALGGLQYLTQNAAVKNATIITPHIYGDSTTGIILSSTSPHPKSILTKCALTPCYLGERKNPKHLEIKRINISADVWWIQSV
jgi:hypothetical protein